jgi:hypothetical protein
MFAEMPLDNRTVANSRPPPPALAFSGRSKRPHGRNDLLFRHGWQFCNIEPKIRQYG